MFRKSLYACDLRHESVPEKTTLVNCCRSKKEPPYMEILWACIERQGLTLHSERRLLFLRHVELKVALKVIICTHYTVHPP